MFVLGIDPGLSRTGYGVISASGSSMRAVAAGVISTAPGDPVATRLRELHDDLAGVIAEYRPDEVAIEEIFVNRNLQTATSVGRASGVAMLTAANAGLDVFEYTPSAVTRGVAGYGDATKEQVQAMVARRLGLDQAPSPADAADALAVALCHLQTAGMRRAVDGARR
ncbi:MAG: crossover junction endodeoxyribonuclease RuvC [Thermoanaerobaculia bacterium]|nr:crossover junction endodeoxyribonuclease RuvC [Thermoanaerobaculia bacterium]